VLLLVVGLPELGDDEEVLALHDALLDGAGDTLTTLLLVAVICRDWISEFASFWVSLRGTKGVISWLNPTGLMKPSPGGAKLSTDMTLVEGQICRGPLWLFCRGNWEWTGGNGGAASRDIASKEGQTLLVLLRRGHYRQRTGKSIVTSSW
jgi:hypothetical protein